MVLAPANTEQYSHGSHMYDVEVSLCPLLPALCCPALCCPALAYLPCPLLLSLSPAPFKATWLAGDPRRVWSPAPGLLRLAE